MPSRKKATKRTAKPAKKRGRPPIVLKHEGPWEGLVDKVLGTPPQRSAKGSKR